MRLIVKVAGVKELQAALSRFGPELVTAINKAAPSIVAPILRPRGDGAKQMYPPQTSSNRPPTPFYIRGSGTQTSARHNRGNSEQMHMRFIVDAKPLKITLSNSASYARYTIGEKPSQRMRSLGWRSMIDIARERIGEITAAFSAAVSAALRGVGLGR